MLRQGLWNCFLLCGLGGQLAAAPAWMALTRDKQLVLFGEDGAKIKSVTLTAPPKNYLALAFGDVLPSVPGKEVVVLRDDEHVDIYPDPQSAASPLKRLGYVKLTPVAGRKPLALTVAELDPSRHGEELLVLQERQPGQAQYVHTYNLADAKVIAPRLDYFILNGPHLPLVALDARNGKAGVELLTAGQDGGIDRYTLNKRDGVRDGRLSCRGGAPGEVMVVRFAASGSAVLLAGNRLERFAGTTRTGQTSLSSPAPVVDFVPLAPSPAVASVPAREVNWTATWPASRCCWVWDNAALPPDGRLVQVKTPEGMNGALVLNSPVKELIVPVNLALPAGTNGVGLWFDGIWSIVKNHDNAIDKHVTFVLRFGDRRQEIPAEKLDAPGDSPLSGRFHSQARYDAWIFWQTFWDREAGPAVLESIKIYGGRARQLMLGPVVAELNVSRPYRAEQVWKIKNFSMIKPWSTHWTATDYHEYGYDSRPFLRPWLWHGARPERVIVELTDAAGAPVQVFQLAGETLTRPLELPELPLGSWFVELAMLGKDHRLLERKRVVLQMLQTGKTVTPSRPELALLPCVVSGFNRHGVSGKPGDRIEFKVTASQELSRRTGLCVWSLTDSEDMSVKAGQVALGGKTQFGIEMICPRPGSYNLTLKFFSPENVELYNTRERFGIAAPALSAASSATTVPVVQEQAQPLMLSMIHAIFDSTQTGRLPQYTLPSLVSSSVAGGNIPVFSVGWGELEPVKGGYNFHLIDRLLDLGSMGGQKPWIGISFGGDNLPEWLWFDELMSQDNRTIHLDYHYVDPMGARFSVAQRELYRRLFGRYRHDNRLGGWFYYAGPSEGFLTDTFPMFCGYGPDDRTRFRAWLKRRYHDNLAELNQSWNTRYSDWQAVIPPYPDWSRSWEDSPAWRDFTIFKQEFVVERIDELQRMFREIDPARPALMYAKEGFGATGVLAPVFKKHRVRYTNGGGETFMSYVQSCIMNNFGVPVTCEGHYVMPNSGSVFYVMANSILAGHFGGNNIQWGLVWAKLAHDQMPETQLIMRATAKIEALSSELHQAVMQSPRWAGYFSAVNSLYSRREFRLKQNPSMTALNQAAQIQLHRPESWVDDYTPTELLSRYPLLVDTDSRVMEASAVTALLDYVKSGHTLVASLWTARFQPGTAKPVDALSRALGVTEVTITRAVAGTTTAKSGMIKMTEVLTPRWNAAAPEVLAADAAGQPLLWKVACGKGTVILAAGNIDFNASVEWLGRILDSYAGPALYTISTDRNVQAGTVGSAEVDFIVIHPLVPGDNRNASIEQMQAAGKVKVRVSGPNLDRAAEVMFDTTLQRSPGVVEFDATPGMLYLLRIKKK